MALGGAWVWNLLGSNIAHATGRTFGAEDDAAIIGLAGDAGADVGGTIPAAWYPSALAGATLVTNTIVIVNMISDSSGAGPLAGGMFRVVKGPTPFRITLTVDGLAAGPAAPIELEVYIIWPHSLMQ